MAETKAGKRASLALVSATEKSSEKEVFFGMEFLSYLISGISLGSVYAIIALGYTMV